jgi:hypothetical protein
MKIVFMFLRVICVWLVWLYFCFEKRKQKAEKLYTIKDWDVHMPRKKKKKY